MWLSKKDHEIIRDEAYAIRARKLTEEKRNERRELVKKDLEKINQRIRMNGGTY